MQLIRKHKRKISMEKHVWLNHVDQIAVVQRFSHQATLVWGIKIMLFIIIQSYKANRPVRED